MPLRTFVHDINESLHVIRLAAEATRFEQAEQRLTAERLDQRLQTILDQVQHLTIPCEMCIRDRPCTQRDAPTIWDWRSWI